MKNVEKQVGSGWRAYLAIILAAMALLVLVPVFWPEEEEKTTRMISKLSLTDYSQENVSDAFYYDGAAYILSRTGNGTALHRADTGDVTVIGGTDAVWNEYVQRIISFSGTKVLSWDIDGGDKKTVCQFPDWFVPKSQFIYGRYLLVQNARHSSTPGRDDALVDIVTGKINYLAMDPPITSAEWCDGEYIYYSSFMDGAYQLARFSLSTGQEETLLETWNTEVISNDVVMQGDYIIYKNNENFMDLWQVSIENGKLEKIDINYPDYGIWTDFELFHSDGKAVILATIRDQDNRPCFAGFGIDCSVYPQRLLELFRIPLDEEGDEYYNRVFVHSDSVVALFDGGVVLAQTLSWDVRTEAKTKAAKGFSPPPLCDLRLCLSGGRFRAA